MRLDAKARRRLRLCATLGAGLGLVLAGAGCVVWNPARANRQASLNEWRTLTAPTNPPPRVFVRGDNLRFYFPATNGWIGFRADWSRLRVPSPDYRVHSALLKWDPSLPPGPEHQRGWREAVVISRLEWRRFATNLVAELAPTTPGHGAYYQAFLDDGVLYRDPAGMPRFASLGDQPRNITIDHRFSAEETLELLARRIEQMLARSYPGESLFLIMASDAQRLTQPLLLDRERRRCVFLTPAALYDPTERGLSLTATAQGVRSLLLESQGVALVKNPVSSAARLADLGVQTAIRFLRMPLPRGTGPLPNPGTAPGMDLGAWETWLDHYTGTRREYGRLDLLIDGDRVFSRLHNAFTAATNNIHVEVYIFDRDDVAVAIADQLKERAQQIDVKVLMDDMGSIAAGVAPPSTPMPEDFVPPNSILGYLRQPPPAAARAFLNPWLSADHSKVLLVDGYRAWIGGMNIGREYRYEWHDLMVELQGPVVAALETEFRRHWAQAGPLGDLAYAATLFRGPQVSPPAGFEETTPIRLLPTRTGWKPFESAVMASLRKARRYVYVENPYLFDKRVLASLVRARRRGVDVRVVLPRVNDFKAGGRSNLVTANYLLEHGVRVYFYPGMTHVKAMLVDDWACLGSGNLNHLSLRLCQEQNLASSDPRFTAQVKHDLFEADFSRSYELHQPISVDWVDFLTDVILENF